MASPHHEHLAEADRHLVVFERLLKQQEARVSQLKDESKTAKAARKLLEEFRETLRLGQAHRALILRELRGELD